MEYKVGDRIVLVKTRPSGWNIKGLMDKYLGTTVTIKVIDSNSFKIENGESGLFQGHTWTFNTKYDIDKEETQKLNNKNTNMLTQFQEVLLRNTVKSLLKANNTITTLEVKNELRRKYPNYNWIQSDVSGGMDNLATAKFLDYTDAGSYRIYSEIKPVVVTPGGSVKLTGTAPKVAKVKTTKSTRRISKNRAIQLLQESNGRFFGVTFVKKDGTTRNMRCQVANSANTKPSSLGYFTVLDVKEKTPKSLNLQTLSEIRLNNTVYKVA